MNNLTEYGFLEYSHKLPKEKNVNQHTNLKVTWHSWKNLIRGLANTFNNTKFG